VAPDDLTRALSRLTGWAIAEKVSLEGLEVIRPSLEDVYLALTGSQNTAGDDGQPTGRADPADPADQHQEGGRAR
jgi:hypothetical protein